VALGRRSGPTLCCWVSRTTTAEVGAGPCLGGCEYVRLRSDNQHSSLEKLRNEVLPSPILPAPPQTSLRAQPFPCRHGGQRTDDRRFLSVPLCFYAKHTEAALVAVKGDALDDAGDFFGRRSALNTSREVEEYQVDLSGVTVLELIIVPNVSRGAARASLKSLRLS
jgi:hypothetical protein